MVSVYTILTCVKVNNKEREKKKKGPGKTNV